MAGEIKVNDRSRRKSSLLVDPTVNIEVEAALNSLVAAD